MRTGSVKTEGTLCEIVSSNQQHSINLPPDLDFRAIRLELEFPHTVQLRGSSPVWMGQAWVDSVSVRRTSGCEALQKPSRIPRVVLECTRHLRGCAFYTPQKGTLQFLYEARINLSAINCMSPLSLDEVFKEHLW